MGKSFSVKSAGKDRQRGFTLVELVIVMAVLVVLAAIAIPRYNGVLHESKVKSDAVTAAGIASAARIQETSTEKIVNGYGDLKADYFEPDIKPASGGEEGEFILAKGGNELYEVTWTPDVGIYSGNLQTVTEGSVFVLNKGE